MLRFSRNLLRRVRDTLTRPLAHELSAQTHELSAQTWVQRSQHDFLMREEWVRSANATENPLNRFGAKYFSQTDEDGITLEIVKRLGMKDGIFAELGVGNGLENNTLILLASGWRGFWIGGQDLAFDHTLNPQRFLFLKDWVSLDNILSLFKKGLGNFGTTELDLLSLDLDGNDYYFVQELLKASIRPKIFILEYNAKFPPPIKWIISYNSIHRWDGTDYFGASLAAFCELLAQFSYTLLCCNAATGANAFFVTNECAACFPEVPKRIEDIFVDCRYQLPLNWGLRSSPKTIERMLQTG